MILYLSGQMTGKPLFNFPLFFEVEKKLKKKGHEIINPARLSIQCWVGNYIIRDDSQWEIGCEKELTNPTVPVSVYYRHDFMALLKCDAIVMLPSFSDSVGARKELQFAKDIGLKLYKYVDGKLEDLHEV